MTRYGMSYSSIRYHQKQSRDLLYYNGIVGATAYRFNGVDRDGRSWLDQSSARDLGHAAIELAFTMSGEQLRNVLQGRNRF